jgi:hypothetical protein
MENVILGFFGGILLCVMLGVVGATLYDVWMDFSNWMRRRAVIRERQQRRK